MSGATALSGAIVAGGLIGWAVDGWRGSEPVGVTAGVILGTVVGVIQLAQIVARTGRAPDEDDGR